jgi:hypothetical protein
MMWSGNCVTSTTIPYEWCAEPTTAWPVRREYVTSARVYHLPVINKPKNWRWFHAFWPEFNQIRSAQYAEVLIRAAFIRIQERYPMAQRLRQKRRHYVQKLSEE